MKGGAWGADFFEESHWCFESPKEEEWLPAAPDLQAREEDSAQSNAQGRPLPGKNLKDGMPVARCFDDEARER